MLIDSHCHLDRLDLSPYDNDFGRFMEHTGQRLKHMLCIAIRLETYPAMLDLVGGYDAVSVSVGVHPNEHDCREPGEDELVELARHPKVVAIGETGLDYFRSEGDLGWQKERFRTHIRAARRAGKPLVIHTREARTDTLAVLKEEGADQVGGVFHCFTEDWETARQALDLGFYLSFSGIVTFRNAEQIQEVARRVPDDRFLVETDSPYLAPIPHRGKPNYPHHVVHVAEFVAALRGQAPDRIAAQTTANYDRLFGRD
ncbi:MAG: TatD family deoxyribonuclease [Methylococcaceae bacterium]|nr:TatD family deoxyribonuclease [Methylococcaceae bacterium]